MLRERLHRLIVILFPAAIQALIVARAGQSMQAWDEFYYVPMLREIGEGRSWYHWIWLQHNEHRIVWTKLLMIAHASFTSWNPIVEMYASACLLACISWGLWRLYVAAGGPNTLSLWPVAFLLCSLAQYMNMLYGIMTCHYFSIAGMVWALVFLSRSSKGSIVAAAGAGTFAMLSTLNAILIWPAGLAVLLLTRQSRARKALWILSATIVTVVYFAHYQSPGSASLIGWSFRTMAVIARAIAVCLGSPFAAGSVDWGLSIGAISLVLTLCVLAGMLANAQWRSHAGLIGLLLIGFGTAGLIGFGRFRYGLSSGMESKYVTYATLALIAPYLMLVCQANHRLRVPLLAAYLTMFTAGWLAANRFALQDVWRWNHALRKHRYVLQTIESQPDENLAEIYHLSEIRRFAAYLRAARLGPFREHIDALLISRWRDGDLCGDCSRGGPRTTLLCPVDTLREVGVLVTPHAAGTLSIALQSGDGRILAHNAVSAETLGDNSWIRIAPNPPLVQCRGQELTVRLWSSGGSTRVRRHPTYYGGITRQGGVVVSRRDLGLEFNGFVAKLLP